MYKFIVAFLYSLVKVCRGLLQDPNIDPSDRNDKFMEACIYGMVNECRRLLRDPNMDPSIDDNIAIRLACYNNRISIVELLLSDKRVDPSAKNNECIKIASNDGYEKIVKLLLDDPRVDPSVDDNYGLEIAAYYGYYKVVKLLLANPRVDPTICPNIIPVALKQSRTELINILLSDKRLYSTLNYGNPKICFYKIAHVRTRATEVLFALQDLNLPAFQTLHILDELFPNDIPMYNLWKLITTVKHFKKI